MAVVASRIAVALRGDRGLELKSLRAAFSWHQIAVALRGDRGLERTPDAAWVSNHRLLRSLFGAIEDWN